MVSEHRQASPRSEEPNEGHRYKVLRLEAVPTKGIPDRGFGILDKRHRTIVLDYFETAEEASAYVEAHLTPQTEPKPKLKTINEISAAEAAKLFRAARSFEGMDDFCLRPEYFPQDIAARDFLQCLDLYSRMYSSEIGGNPSTTSYAVEHLNISDEQRAELAKIASTIPEDELDEKLPVGSREREAFDVLRQNPGWSNKEIAKELGIAESTVKTYLLRAYDKLGLEGGRKEVWAKYRLRKT